MSLAAIGGPLPLGGGLVLLRPLWLLALPVAPLLALLVRRAGGLGSWRRAVDPVLLAALAARGGLAPAGRLAGLLPTLVALPVVLALAGPAHQRDRVGAFTNLDGLVIAFDVSRSVAAGGNLVTARLLAARVAEAVAPRPVALVAYAGDAYTACGFTSDPAVLGGLLAALDGDTVPDAGTRPARALALAARLLAEARIIRGDVLLVSDGGNIDADTAAAARDLRASGSPVSTLFVPATAALPTLAPAPDRAAMDRLAATGGGVAGDLDAPQALLATLAERPARRLARSDYAVLAYADLGRFLLLPALLPALLLFRRRA